MPAPPEFSYAARDERIVEIFGKAEAENTSQADSHVAVAGEVKIDLKREGNGIDPVEADGLIRAVAENGAKLAHCVGDKDLLRQTEYKAANTEIKPVKCALSLVKLRGNIGVAHDRSCDKLRKQTDVGGKRKQAFLRVRPAAIHVDRVAHGLKGEKADAYGQRNFCKGKAAVKKGVYSFDEKVGIFKKAQHGEVYCDRGDERKLCFFCAAMLFDKQTVGVIGKGGEKQKQRINRLAEKVEHEAGEQQNMVFKPLGYQKVQKQHYRQKDI